MYTELSLRDLFFPKEQGIRDALTMFGLLIFVAMSCRLTFREERRDVFAKYFGERHAKDFFPSCA